MTSAATVTCGRVDPEIPRAIICAVPAGIEPELWVENTAEAIAYYQEAFGAVVEHRVGGPDDPDGVAQLSVGSARFWVAGAAAEMGRFSPSALQGATSRTLLVVDDPGAVVVAASAAGGRVTRAVTEEHGWLLGRIIDPAGHEWEIGRPLGDWPPAPR